MRDARDGEDEETYLEISAADGSARDFPRTPKLNTDRRSSASKGRPPAVRTTMHMRTGYFCEVANESIGHRDIARFTNVNNTDRCVRLITIGQ